ncbi:MAG TPA: DNA-directed RNA polymerase subunit alpha C-terminal domain-containing protein [Candidatus Saccharimonadales bacterium]|nr:DNA-directed RNA polymerase subunit alpha C-terminal domain-containing protein [Candidatus Saccharimonadales bacterium]
MKPLTDEELAELTPEELIAYNRGLGAGIEIGYKQGVQAALRHMQSMPTQLTPTPDSTPLEELDLTVRTFNVLTRHAEVSTIGELLAYAETHDLLELKNFDKKTLDELREKLRRKGYALPRPS